MILHFEGKKEQVSWFKIGTTEAVLPQSDIIYTSTVPH